MTLKTLGIVLASIAAVAGVFGAGYQVGHRKTAAVYEAKIQAANEAAVKQAAIYRQQEQENAKRVSDALAARDKALADARDLRVSIARVRQQSSNLSTQLSRASRQHAAAGDGNSERLGKCESLLAESAALLGEGVEMAGEGAELSSRIAADKDVILKGVQ